MSVHSKVPEVYRLTSLAISLEALAVWKGMASSLRSYPRDMPWSADALYAFYMERQSKRVRTTAGTLSWQGVTRLMQCDHISEITHGDLYFVGQFINKISDAIISEVKKIGNIPSSYVADLLSIELGSKKVWVVAVQCVLMHVVVLAGLVPPLEGAWREGRH